MPITPLEYLGLAVLGMVAGTLGGLLGVGGSLLVVPVLVLYFPFDGQPTDIHLAIAAAMIMNTWVGGMSTYRHWRVGNMQVKVIRWLLPAAFIGVSIGVVWGNTFVDESSKRILRQAFGFFALGVAIYYFLQLLRGFRKPPPYPPPPEADLSDEIMSPTPAPLPMVVVGFPAGLMAGLLGIGGGGITVPFQQIFLGLPLKNAIGNSAATVFAASFMGAILKLSTAGYLLPADYGIVGPLWIAAGLLPTSILGAFWGAYLTRVLPTHWVLAPFIVLMLLMGCRLVIGG